MKNLQKKYYFLKPRIFWRALSIILLSTGLFLIAASVLFLIDEIMGHKNSLIFLACILLMVIFLSLVCFELFMVFSAKLELYDDGILFNGGYYRIYTPWKNIMSIHKVSHAMLVIELNEDAIIGKICDKGNKQGIAVIERRRVSWWLGSDTFLLKGHTHFIRLSTMMVSPKEWLEGDFRSYIELYAPYLLKNIDSREN